MPIQSFAVFAAILFTTLIMRGPITVVGPIAEQIQSTLQIDYATYGVLAALPVLSFGIFSLLTPIVTKALRIGYALALLCALVFFGSLARLNTHPCLFMAATVLIAAGIAMLNTVMPVFVRQYFPISTEKSIAWLTAFIGVSSCMGSFCSVPLFIHAQSIELPLVVWCAPAALAFVFWLSTARRTVGLTISDSEMSRGLFKSGAVRFASSIWAVIGTMGFQSLTMYAVSSWLPTLLMAQDFSMGQAGLCTSLFVLFTVPASLLTDLLIRFCHGEKRLSVAVTQLFVPTFVTF